MRGIRPRVAAWDGQHTGVSHRFSGHGLSQQPGGKLPVLGAALDADAADIGIPAPDHSGSRCPHLARESPQSLMASAPPRSPSPGCTRTRTVMPLLAVRKKHAHTNTPRRVIPAGCIFLTNDS